ncbi:MAG: energy-coupled thiamine transporter ThiT [Firmicutes bacterium]|nr:energy-coupled thiamine transporter ThiT [Bacillota bacterium]
MQEFFEAWYGQLVTAAVALVLILVGVGFVIGKNRKQGTKMLVYSAMAVAVATVLSFLKIVEMPQGGSITLFSMFAITLIGYFYGPAQGILCGMAYGLIQLVTGPYVIHPAQLLMDYPLAFGMLGLAGFLNKRPDGLLAGYVLGVFGRLIMSVLSGVIFFAEYAGDMDPFLYSVGYNIAYLGGEALLTAVVFMVIPSVKKAVERIKIMAQ